MLKIRYDYDTGNDYPEFLRVYLKTHQTDDGVETFVFFDECEDDYVYKPW